MADAPDAELDEFATSIRNYCRERLPAHDAARPGAIRDGDAARATWDKLRADLGLASLLVPEDFGGDGASLVEAARAMEALGAELATAPALATGVLAPTLLTALAREDADSPAAALLQRIVDGDVVAVAWADGDPEAVTGAPLHALDAQSASGNFNYVIDADIADVVVLVGDRGTQIAAVEAAELSVRPRAAFDLTRGLAEIHATSVPAVSLGSGETARSAFAAMLSAGRVAIAAECAGGAQAALALAVAYAKQRVQFGREIGSFQAVKHLLADAFVNAESATSVARAAAQAYVLDGPDAAELVAAASFYCADRFADVAATGIQVHGGIGFTVECAAHLYRRRAESDRHIFGDPATAKARYVALLSGEEAAV